MLVSPFYTCENAMRLSYLCRVSAQHKQWVTNPGCQATTGDGLTRVSLESMPRESGNCLALSCISGVRIGPGGKGEKRGWEPSWAGPQPPEWLCSAISCLLNCSRNCAFFKRDPHPPPFPTSVITYSLLQKHAEAWQPFWGPGFPHWEKDCLYSGGIC